MKSINGMQTGQLSSILSFFYYWVQKKQPQREHYKLVFYAWPILFVTSSPCSSIVVCIRPGTIVRIWRFTTRGRSRLEATTSFVIIRRARHSTKLSLHRVFPVSAARVWNGLTAGTRHIVAVVTRLQTAFEDSPLLREFLRTAASQ